MPIGFYIVASASVLIFLYVIYMGINRLIYLAHISSSSAEIQKENVDIEGILKLDELNSQYQKIKQEQEQTKIQLEKLLTEIGKQASKEKEFKDAVYSILITSVLSKLSSRQSLSVRENTYSPYRDIFDDRIGMSAIKYQASYKELINSPYENEISNN
jgi:hypothetical protein